MVLVVDDEPMIRTLIRSVLESNGFRVEEADCACEVIDRLSEYLDSIDLLITDIRMPGKSGSELAKTIRASRPELPVVFISGYSEVNPIDGDVPTNTEYLAKPFTLPSLLKAVRQLLTRERVAV